MPARQRGQAYRTARGWGVRFYDENGVRRRRSGFRSRSEALEWFERVERPRQLGLPVAPPDRTLSEFVAGYLEAHAVGREPSTIRTLAHRLSYAERAFGDLRLSELERRAPEIAAWTRTLPEGSRYGIVQALRQTLETAVRWGLLRENPARLAGRNPQPRREEVRPFTGAELEAVAAELDAPGAALVVFAAETGLRPSEWIALERRDLDRAAGVALVERTVTAGRLRPYAKTERSRRRVPLSSRALAALDELPPRLGSPLIFPAPSGGYLDLHNWRARVWAPALEAAGLYDCCGRTMASVGRPGAGLRRCSRCGAERRARRVYDLRHTFATNALAVGLSIFEVARYMGTSVAMIDRTYGHLARGSESSARERLDRLGHDWATGESRSPLRERGDSPR